MNNFSISTTEPLPNFGAIQSEIIYLEPEHFERAVEISSQITNENHRWKTYLSVLALCSFEEWLNQQASDILISTNYSSILQHQCTTESTALSYLKLGEFDVCLIVSESVADEIIFLPRNAIESPELIAHFYVVIEILEEQEEAIIQGCLRYDKLINHQSLTLIDDNYQLPLYLFNTEINHLLLAPRLLSPTAIIPKIENNIIKLNNWLQNTFETTWLAIEELLDTALLSRTIVWQQAFYRSDEDNTEQIYSTSDQIQELLNQIANNTNEFQLQKAIKRLGVIARGNNTAILTLINLLETTQDDEILWTTAESLWQISPGVTSAGVRRVKLIDLGMQVAGRTVALAVAIIQKLNGQFGVLLRVYPTHGEPYLPARLKLILLDNTGEILHEAVARTVDNYIQIKLSGNTGETFSVRIVFESSCITEDFEI